MKSNGLNDKQFITVALVIILCGIAILGHDYFMAKRAGVYNDMSILLSQEPEVVERVNRSVSVSDTSGKVKKINTTYNYVGRIKIPKINLNRGFLKYGQRGNNVWEVLHILLSYIVILYLLRILDRDGMHILLELINFL